MDLAQLPGQKSVWRDESQELVEVGDWLLPRRYGFTYQPAAETDVPGWTVEFEVRDGAPQCRRIAAVSTPHGREVRPVDLRSLSIEDLLEAVSTNVALKRSVDEDGQPVYEHDLRDWQSTVKAVRSRRRLARRKVTDGLLQMTAEVYRENIARHPTQAVSAHFGVAHRTAALYVQRAREAGYLGKSVRGKAGEHNDG